MHPQITLLDGTRIGRVTSYAPQTPGAHKGFLYYILKNLAITADPSLRAWPPTVRLTQ